MKCTHRHLCPEWDYMEIDTTDKEYQACICECPCIDIDTLTTCDNCQYESNDGDEFEMTTHGLFCRDCACCSQCREIVRQLKADATKDLKRG